MFSLISSHGVLAVQPSSKNQSSRIAAFVDVSSQSYLSQLWDSGRMTSMLAWGEKERRTTLSNQSDNGEVPSFSTTKENVAATSANVLLNYPSTESTPVRSHLCFSAFPTPSASSSWMSTKHKSDEVREMDEVEIMRKNGTPYDSESDDDDDDDMFSSRRMKKDKKIAKEETHVALVYEASKGNACNTSFFSAFVLRCDTWAVQWAVGPLVYSNMVNKLRSTALESGITSKTTSFIPTSHIALLHSGLLCGVAAPEDKDLSVAANSLALFVAAQPPLLKKTQRAHRRPNRNRAFLGSTFLFPLSEIKLVDKGKDGHLLPDQSSSFELNGLTILENERKKKSPAGFTPIALTAVSDHSVVVLFASGGVYEFHLHQGCSSALESMEEKEEGNETEKIQPSSSVTEIYSGSPSDGHQNMQMSVTAAYFGEVPGWGASPQQSTAPSCGLKALHRTGAEETYATVLAVYEQKAELVRDPNRKLPKVDEKEDIIHLLSFSSPEPQWSKIVVNKDFFLRDVVGFVPDAFPSTASLGSSSASTSATPVLLLHLQERAAPFTDAVQGVILVLSTSMTVVDEVIPLPVLKLPCASLRLMGSYYSMDERAHVLICASSKRTQFFHNVRFSLFQPFPTGTMEEMYINHDEDPNYVGEDYDFFLEHPESWVATKVFYEESLGGYSPDALCEIGKKNGCDSLWIPLLLPFSGRQRGGLAGFGEGGDGSSTLDEEENGLRSLRVQGSWKDTNTTSSVVKRHFPPPIELTYPLTAFCKHPLQFSHRQHTSAVSMASVAAAHIAIFTVSVAPGIHTRLAKQWHNGIQGLRLLVQQVVQCSNSKEMVGRGDVNGVERSTMKLDKLTACCAKGTAGVDPLFILLQHQWHPKYIRQVLRSLNATQLGWLLQSVCQFILKAGHREEIAARRIETGKREEVTCRDVWYFQAATYAVPLALQIISLARQKGLALTTFLLPVTSQGKNAEGSNASCYRCTSNDMSILSPLLELLRGSRSLGHPLRRLLPRMEMMVETGRQQRMLYALLVKNKKFYITTTSTNTKKKEEESGNLVEEGPRSSVAMNESDFYVMRSLVEGTSSSAQGGDAASKQKYVPNSWAHPLIMQEEALSVLVSEAQGYLKTLEQDLNKLSPELFISTPQEGPHSASLTPSRWLIDWRSWGSRSHSDSFLRVFESGIIAQHD